MHGNQLLHGEQREHGELRRVSSTSTHGPTLSSSTVLYRSDEDVGPALIGPLHLGERRTQTRTVQMTTVR